MSADSTGGIRFTSFGKKSDIDASFIEGKFLVTLFAEAHKFHWSMDSISDFTKILTMIQKTGHKVPLEIFLDIQDFCNVTLDNRQPRGN
jgi:hypothetical protein